MRQLISSDEAVSSHGEQHRKPCGDCPFARKSLRGWLGGLSIQEWLDRARGDNIEECHTIVPAQCAGLAIFRKHMCKSPRNPLALRLEADRKLVFSTPAEFTEHHSRRMTKEELNARQIDH